MDECICIGEQLFLVYQYNHVANKNKTPLKQAKWHIYPYSTQQTVLNA